ncbi:MAG: exodeoxyribonuclease VII large subunit [Pseudomonadota bacterium]
MPDSAQSNALEVTVTELSGKLKRTVEDTFGHVRVRGEISGFRGPHSSGHCYFSLKDERARLEAVIWRGQAAKLAHMPEEGLEVIASGKLTTYPGSSKYQIVIDNLEPAGAGALMALLEQRRKKLLAEGLFDEARKQLLPFMPKVVGVVTSPTGAVIRDILHRIADRFPVHVVVWPVRVQGETSGREVANGIYQLNQLPEEGPIPKPDVIIVARGGGSLEDLWGFNDEALVRAAADSFIPLISAVGHETDWTLVDLAADWRAPTPTAAAEKAVPVKADLEATLADLSARMRGAMRRLGERKRTALAASARGLKTPDTLLAMPRRQFDEAVGRFDRSYGLRLERARSRLAQVENRHAPALLSRRLDRARSGLQPWSERHANSLAATMRRAAERLVPQANRLRVDLISRPLLRQRERFNRAFTLLPQRLHDGLERSKMRFNRSDRLLNSLGHKGVLERGYAILMDETGTVLRHTKDLPSGTAFRAQLADDTVTAISRGLAEGATSSGRGPSEQSAPKTVKPAKKTNREKIDQGTLF